ncbi:MAG: Crp/Fnr family transcriptional regulator [Cyclobacteriaceae bacterium]|nr:Crp/Fnr family transcriptional regulator [Cyclobacteriaceae bacterium]
MMTDPDEIKKVLPGLSAEIYDILSKKGKKVDIPRGQTLLKEGYYVNALPIVLDGLLKVTSRDEDKEILLYYINRGESCIMSFSACITNSASKIFAVTETDSTVLMISADTLNALIRSHPSFNGYFYQLYQFRYEELIGAIDQLVFKKFDERLFEYLKEKSEKLGHREIKITHQEIAQDTGTAREVVSRALKKMEKEGKVQLRRNEIKIL